MERGNLDRRGSTGGSEFPLMNAIYGIHSAHGPRPMKTLRLLNRPGAGFVSLSSAVLMGVLAGLRATPEVERAGLDVREHGEEGYIT